MKSETLPAPDFATMSVSDFKEHIKAIRRALGELPLPKGPCVRGEGDAQINKPKMNADPTRPV